MTIEIVILIFVVIIFCLTLFNNVRTRRIYKQLRKGVGNIKE
jgi:hypothetical protein